MARKKSDIAAPEVVGSEKLFITLPEAERRLPGVNCLTKTKQQYIVTQNINQRFTLWRAVENGFVKVETASSPYDLYPLVPWDE